MKIPTPLDIAICQLASTEAPIRKLGAQAICRLKPQSFALDIQQLFILEQDDGVAKWLALALGEIGDVRSLPILEAKLKVLPDNDLNHWIQVACNMLMKFAESKLVKDLLVSKDSGANTRGLLISWKNPNINEDATKFQGRLLDSADPVVRRWATLALGSKPDFVVNDQILEHLSDPDYLVLEWTEHVISGKTPSSSVPHLLKNLTHKEPRVREWAIKALAACGESGIWRVLLRHYGTESDTLCREAIVRALCPYCEEVEVVDFIYRCIRDEANSVIIAALIDVIATSTKLRESDVLVRDLITKTRQTNSEALGLAFNHAFSLYLPKEDRDIIQTMGLSSKAQEAWGFLSSLPWNEERATHVPLNAIKTGSSFRRNTTMEGSTKVITVAVLIAKKEEFRSFVPVFGEYESIPDEQTGKSAYKFMINDNKGRPIQVIALFVGEMGPERSAHWANRLNEEFEPAILVNIGIAGGIHNDVVVGDVVVATQVDNYLANAKAKPNASGEGFDFDLAGDPFKTDRYLSNLLQQFEFSHPQSFVQWQEGGVQGLLNVDETDRISLLEKGLIRKAPIIEEGHVASGQIVGAASSFIDWLKSRRDRTFLALEMESAGVSVALYEGCKTTKFLAIKGISDYGDERKKDLDAIGKGKLRNLAMQNATRLLLALLKDIDINCI